MFLKVLVLVTAMSSCYCQFDGLCPNMLDDIKLCAAEFIDTISELSGRFIDGASVLDAERMLTTSLTIVCTNKAPLENFYKCFYTKFLACIPPEWTKALPSMDQAVDSISYLCDNAADVDLSCVTNNIQKVSPCVSSAITKGETGDLSTADGYVSLMCRAYPLMENCYRSVMSACPARTGEVLAGYIKYQRPAGCGATMVRFSLALLVVSLCYTWLKNLI